MSTFTQRINVVDSELVGKAADVCRTELPVFLSRMDCTLNPSNNITDGAVPNVIVVLDDDDDETDYRYTAAHDGGVADHRKDSQETFPMDNENNSLVALSLFSSILPQCSHENAMYWLRKFEWNVEAAIDAALTSNIDIKEIDISCDNKTNQQNHGAPSAKKRSMTDDESHQKVHQRSPNRKLIFDTKDHVSKYNATGSSSDVPTGTNKYTFSVEWQATMERFQSEDPAEHFIDSFFPPTLQSLDGRQRHQHHGSDQNAAGPLNNTRQQQSNRSSSGSSNETTLCHCGYPAAAKRVQSDGPNYGRFYLACGQIQRRRAKVLAIRRSKRFKSDDTDGSPVAPSNAVVDAISISTDVDVTENSVAKGADVILVSNPYAKKSCTIEKPTTPTKATLQRTESSPSSPPTPQRRQCTFFQWDRTGSLGAANNHSQCTRDGYGSILNDDDENGNVRSHRSISWFRFGMEQRCMLFQKHMETSHVRQGAIGDCWFLSALAVVAEKPHLMQRVVPHDGKLNKAGCYQINLYLDGCWKAVVVDSYLPIVLLELDGNKSHSTSGRMTVRDISTRLRDGVPVVVSKASHQVPGKQSAKSISSTSCLALPAFCAAPDRQLWPCLVEKAYAKAHGSYQQLSGGFIAEGLQDLTGAPTETIVFANGLFDPESLWTRLLSFSSAGFLMGVATARGGDGLVGGHAYSVLDVLEIRDVMVGEQPKVSEFFTSKKSPEVVELLKHTKTLNKPKGSVSAMLDSEIDDTPANDMISVPQRGKRASVRLVRIRNPWGKREWKGDWSADSERWTKALRKRLGDGTFAKGDGTFYMSFDDMLQRFHHMDVAKAREV